jgi:hypothetical protein
MRVLVTGKGGKAGSWAVRGVQLGAAMGATVKPMATRADMRKHDVVLVVKRCPPELLTELRASGVPWAYDIVDAYPQPACSVWPHNEARSWLCKLLLDLHPHRTVFANKRMREDAGELDSAVVYHHHRPGIERNPIRERMQVVGYEGGAHYVPAWLPLECTKRGLQFVVNPPSLASLDVVVAMRGGVWDGYCQKNWKSNVKLANAHASGTPFIGSPECGYQETATGCEYWAESPRDFHSALDWLESQAARQTVHERFVAASYSVDQAAKDMLCALNF